MQIRPPSCCQLTSTWTSLVPTEYPPILVVFFTFAWFWVICGISNFPIVLLSLFSRAQTAKNTILNCRKSCSFRLWPWFLLVSESWQIKSLNFLSKFPEVSKARWVTGLEDAMVHPGGWQLLPLRNRAGGPWAPLFSKCNTQKCATVSFSTIALSATPICSLSLGNLDVLCCQGPEMPKEAQVVWRTMQSATLVIFNHIFSWQNFVPPAWGIRSDFFLILFFNR